MNKFSMGEKVVCKVGGPMMGIASVPPEVDPVVANNDIFGQPLLVQQPKYYNCLWWQINANGVGQFMQWTFHEDMLEEAPTK